MQDVKLLHMHPTSSFATEGAKPPEHVVFQVGDSVCVRIYVFVSGCNGQCAWRSVCVRAGFAVRKSGSHAARL